MRGFYFENHNNLKIESGQGPIQIGQLDLEAGSYMLWGKLSLGVNTASGYPPLPWPHTTGVAFLVLGEAEDQAYYGLKPASAENNGTLSLMCAASISSSRRARLHLVNLYPLPVYCHHIKLMALQVDALVEHEVGEQRHEAPEDKEESFRDSILRAKLIDKASIRELMNKG
jgi:hypothetical protein